MSTPMNFTPVRYAETKASIEKIVKRFCRRVWWARKPDVIDDLTQHGWVVALECAATWESAVGVPWAGYLESALVLRLPEQLWQLSSPASASKHDREQGKLKSAIRAEPTYDPRGGVRHESYDGAFSGLHNNEAAVREQEAAQPWVDKLLTDREWHVRARRALAAVALEDRTIMRGLEFSLERMDRADEPAVSAPAYAKRRSMPLHEVYRSAAAAKARIRVDRELHDLIKEREK